MLGLDAFDLEQIGSALSDQTDYEHHWLVDPLTGEVVLWTLDTGIDGQNPIDLDELDLILIEPLPPRVWYRDMEDFAAGVDDPQASQRLTLAIEGRGAFRRFKNELYNRQPERIAEWHAFRDARARQRAIEWLRDHDLVLPGSDSSP
jgi:hypothetical protein